MKAALGAEMIDPSCRLYIPFNEGTGDVAKDYSQYGNNGVLTDVKWGMGGGGNACKFNGTSAFVNCGNDASLNITGDITVETWMKTSDTRSAQFFFGRGNTGTTGWRASVEGGNTISFFVGNGTEYARVEKAYTTGEWVHVVAVRNGTDVTIYVNGVQGTTDTLSGSITYGAFKLAIGHRAVPTGAVGRFFNGTIDEVKIYNRALSAQKIRASYDATKVRYGLV